MGLLLAVDHTSRSASDKAAQRNRAVLGVLAEAMVAQWLIQQGWRIVVRRWHCRWGELDLVAQAPETAQSTTLIFVEVKARNCFNWDEGGLLAITPQKQAKLWQAAELFLTEHPALAELPCRFDVALVASQRLPQPVPDLAQLNLEAVIPSIELGSPITLAGHRLTLQHYLEAAFEH